MKIRLQGRVIPRNEGGDPHFVYLNDAHLTAEPQTTADAFHVLGVFSPEEVVELVNRALYQLEYQHTSHKTRAKEERERLHEVKVMVRKMFHVSWLKATPEQVEAAVKALAKGGGDETTK
jgi:hypothetical protein